MKFWSLSILALGVLAFPGNGSGNGNGKNGNGNGNGKNKPNFPGKKPKVLGVTYDGNGCPANSASVSLSDDFTVMTVIYDQFIASSGSGLESDAVKKCSLKINLDYPTNWTYAIDTITYRGFANIPAALTGVISSRYRFSNNAKEQFKTKFTNYADDYVFDFSVPLSEIERSKCGANLFGRIDTAAKILGDLTVPGLLTVDSTDRKVVQQYALNWQQC